MNNTYKSKVRVDVTDPRSMEFGTTQNLRRIAQNERHISRNQRGEAASALDWAADRIEELEKRSRRSSAGHIPSAIKRYRDGSSGLYRE